MGDKGTIVKDDALKLWRRTIQRRETPLDGQTADDGCEEQGRGPSRLWRQARPCRLSRA